MTTQKVFNLLALAVSQRIVEEQRLLSRVSKLALVVMLGLFVLLAPTPTKASSVAVHNATTQQSVIYSSLSYLEQRGYGAYLGALLTDIWYVSDLPWGGAACPPHAILIGPAYLGTGTTTVAALILHEMTHLEQTRLGYAYDPVFSEGQADGPAHMLDPYWPLRQPADIWKGYNAIPCPKTQAYAPMVGR